MSREPMVATGDRAAAGLSRALAASPAPLPLLGQVSRGLSTVGGMPAIVTSLHSLGHSQPRREQPLGVAAPALESGGSLKQHPAQFP